MQRIQRIILKLKRQRRGSALLLSLGILSLMLIMAMVFAFDARSSQKIADNYANATRARLLNQSGFKKAIDVLDSLFGSVTAGNAYLNPAVSFVDGPAGDWEGCRYFAALGTGTAVLSDELDSAFSSLLYYDGGALQYTPADSSDLQSKFSATPELGGTGFSATWDSVVLNIDGNNMTTGLVSWLIIDQTGKIDPGKAGITDAGPVTGTMSDVNINRGFNIDGTVPTTNTYQAQGCLSLPDYVLETGIMNTDVKEVLFPGMTSDSELFWMDLDANGECEETDDETNEVFPRLNLARIADDGLGSKEETIQKLYTFFLTNKIDGTVDVTTDSSTSAWMHATDSSKITDARTAQKAAARMAVMLYDFADTDKESSVAWVDPTSGALTVEEWSSFTPSSKAVSDVDIVYGVEDATGLTEIVAGMNCTYIAGPPNKVKIEFVFKIALLNPISNTYTPNVDMDFTYSLTGGTVSPVTLPTANYTMNDNGGGRWTGTYTSNPVEISLTGSYQLTSLKITRLEIKDNATNEISRKYPVCETGITADWFVNYTSPSEGGVLSTSFYHHAQLQTADPLFDKADPLFDEMDLSNAGFITKWKIPEPCTDNSLMVKAAIPAPSGAVATVYDDLPYSDVTAPNTITKVGDLGRVHSPYKNNQSLRLWIKTPTDAGDGIWHDGYILDMFMHETDAAVMDGDDVQNCKVNPNTSSVAVANALLCVNEGMRSNADRDKIRAAWVEANGSPAFKYRGDMYRIFDEGLPAYVAGGYPSYTTSDDDVAEGAIGDMIGLLDTRYNYYTIITASRAIKDIGTVNLGADKCISIGGSKYGIVEGSYKTMTTVKRDAWRRKSKIMSINVLED